MATSLVQLLFFLLAGIAVIILLTAKYRVNAFFALLIAAFLVGFGVQLPAAVIIAAVKDGFGNTMRSLGLIIVLGTTLGVLLEYSGCSRVMAGYILKKTGEKRAPLAMSLTGFIVGLPVFCDSGYIVLSGLNNSLAKRTGISIVIMAVSLATGLYAVHCLIPPHPGASAGAAAIGVGFGKLTSIGILVAIPGMIIGNFWARFAGKKIPHVTVKETVIVTHTAAPSVFLSFLPVIVPIILIAVDSFLSLEKSSSTDVQKIFSVLGEPAIALSVGVLFALVSIIKWNRHSLNEILQTGIEKAGSILIIIGAGGSFGAVLAATGIGNQLSHVMNLAGMGIFFPFLLTFILKTAQGSSTVAIITAASIVLPLLSALGLDSENGRLLCVLSMGAGSMMISHANDAYFWVIAKFSGMDMKSMLKVYTVSTILMGLITLLTVYILSLFLL